MKSTGTFYGTLDIDRFFRALSEILTEQYADEGIRITIRRGKKHEEKGDCDRNRDQRGTVLQSAV